MRSAEVRSVNVGEVIDNSRVNPWFLTLCGLVTDIGTFAVLRFISGFGLAAMTPIVSSILSEYSPRKIRSQVVANVCLGFTVGQLLAIAAGLVLLVALSWRVMFLLAFPAILLAVVFTIRMDNTLYLGFLALAGLAPIVIGLLLTIGSPDVVFFHVIPFAIVGGLATWLPAGFLTSLQRPSTWTRVQWSLARLSSSQRNETEHE